MIPVGEPNRRRRLQAQVELFPAPAPAPRELQEVEKRVSHRRLHVSKSTFKGGLDAPFHRWFRLTPSFGPDLVTRVLTEVGATSEDVVLDPFSGAGTTLIECQMQGLSSFGFEINPFLHFVGKTSTNWTLDAASGRRLLAQIKDEYALLARRLGGSALEETDLQIPSIHNVHRWWRTDVLKEMLMIKRTITQVAEEAWQDFFRLGLAAVLVPDLTNVTLGRLQLHFIDRSKHDIRAWPTFERHVCRMLDDLEGGTASSAKASLFHTDATSPGTPVPRERATLVITSPPYPNRYSYVWNTRPHLYMLDFFSGKSEAGELDRKTIGGTWGTATSILAKGEIVPEYPVAQGAAIAAVKKIREVDVLMANYVMKYFNMLARQIVAMDAYVSSNVKVAYVVGNSCIKDVYVETDVILGQMFEALGLGYRVQNIERFRKRHSGVDLYETTVFAEKRG
jgi:hypothetical protein